MGRAKWVDEIQMQIVPQTTYKARQMKVPKFVNFALI